MNDRNIYIPQYIQTVMLQKIDSDRLWLKIITFLSSERKPDLRHGYKLTANGEASKNEITITPTKSGIIRWVSKLEGLWFVNKIDVSNTNRVIITGVIYQNGCLLNE